LKKHTVPIVRAEKYANKTASKKAGASSALLRNSTGLHHIPSRTRMAEGPAPEVMLHVLSHPHIHKQITKILRT
jgi:hypothetical protein